MAKKPQGGLYDETPSIKGDEKGKPHVVKPSKHDASDGASDKGVEGEGFPIHARHASERRALHHQHETEHSMHEAHGDGDKKEMHHRHESAIKSLHTKHEKEAGMDGGKEAGAGGATGKVSEPTKKIEENKKG